MEERQEKDTEKRKDTGRERKISLQREQWEIRWLKLLVGNEKS